MSLFNNLLAYAFSPRRDFPSSSPAEPTSPSSPLAEQHPNRVLKAKSKPKSTPKKRPKKTYMAKLQTGKGPRPNLRNQLKSHYDATSSRQSSDKTTGNVNISDDKAAEKEASPEVNDENESPTDTDRIATFASQPAHFIAQPSSPKSSRKTRGQKKADFDEEKVDEVDEEEENIVIFDVPGTVSDDDDDEDSPLNIGGGDDEPLATPAQASDDEEELEHEVSDDDQKSEHEESNKVNELGQDNQDHETEEEDLVELGIEKDDGVEPEIEKEDSVHDAESEEDSVVPELEKEDSVEPEVEMEDNAKPQLEEEDSVQSDSEDDDILPEAAPPVESQDPTPPTATPLDDEMDLDDDEATQYVFTKILDYRWVNDAIELQIAWHNSGTPTWEPESNIHRDSPDALFNYWRDVHGGRPANPDDPDLFDVFAIVKHAPNRKRLYVEWTGFPPEERTWEPAGEIKAAAPEIVEEYWRVAAVREKKEKLKKDRMKQRMKAAVTKKKGQAKAKGKKP